MSIKCSDFGADYCGGNRQNRERMAAAVFSRRIEGGGSVGVDWQHDLRQIWRDSGLTSWNVGAFWGAYPAKTCFANLRLGRAANFRGPGGKIFGKSTLRCILERPFLMHFGGGSGGSVGVPPGGKIFLEKWGQRTILVRWIFVSFSAYYV